MGIPKREMTSARVVLRANVSGTIDVLLKRNLFVDAKIRSTVDDPARKRMKVQTPHMSRFLRLWAISVAVCNLAREKASVAGRYLGRLVPIFALGR